MNNLSIVPSSPIDDFIIDDLIKDDVDIYINSNDPELQSSKFLFGIGKVEAENRTLQEKRREYDQ